MYVCESKDFCKKYSLVEIRTIAGTYELILYWRYSSHSNNNQTILMGTHQGKGIYQIVEKVSQSQHKHFYYQCKPTDWMEEQFCQFAWNF